MLSRVVRTLICLLSLTKFPRVSCTRLDTGLKAVGTFGGRGAVASAAGLHCMHSIRGLKTLPTFVFQALLTISLVEYTPKRSSNS